MSMGCWKMLDFLLFFIHCGDTRMSFECCWELSSRERKLRGCRREYITTEARRGGEDPGPHGWVQSSSSCVGKHRVWLQIVWGEQVGGGGSPGWALLSKMVGKIIPPWSREKLLEVWKGVWNSHQGQGGGVGTGSNLPLMWIHKSH